jgi:transposase InsO family protein
VRAVLTRPCRPQTNGKVEPFNRTLLEERPMPACTAQKPTAPPPTGPTPTITTAATALGGKSPIDLVPNLRGQNV